MSQKTSIHLHILILKYPLLYWLYINTYYKTLNTGISVLNHKRTKEHLVQSRRKNKACVAFWLYQVKNVLSLGNLHYIVCLVDPKRGLCALSDGEKTSYVLNFGYFPTKILQLWYKISSQHVGGKKNKLECLFFPIGDNYSSSEDSSTNNANTLTKLCESDNLNEMIFQNALWGADCLSTLSSKWTLFEN